MDLWFRFYQVTDSTMKKKHSSCVLKQKDMADDSNFYQGIRAFLQNPKQTDSNHHFKWIVHLKSVRHISSINFY